MPVYCVQLSWCSKLPEIAKIGGNNSVVFCMRLQGHLQTSSPIIPRKLYPKVQNPKAAFQNTPFSGEKSHSARGRGGARIYFCYLGAHAKQPLLGEK